MLSELSADFANKDQEQIKSSNQPLTKNINHSPNIQHVNQPALHCQADCGFETVSGLPTQFSHMLTWPEAAYSPVETYLLRNEV